MNVLINGGKNMKGFFLIYFCVKKLKSTENKSNKKVSFKRGVRVIGWQNVKEIIHKEMFLIKPNSIFFLVLSVL